MSRSVAQALREAAAALPAAEARLLMQALLGLSHAALAARPERLLDADESARFDALAGRRAAGEPVAYLLGRREFHGIEFEVGPAVLIPRPETELLVDLALSEARARAGEAVSMLDLGTGSGCVAVALACALPAARITAVDAAAEALLLARRNAERHGAAIRFLQSDWFAAVGDERFGVIVANPPYIAAGDPHLAQGDLRFEPPAALASGADGLDALRRIVAAAPSHLAPGGALLVEHGYDQAEAVAKLFAAAGLTRIAQHADLAGILRVTAGRREPAVLDAGRAAP